MTEPQILRETGRDGGSYVAVLPGMPGKARLEYSREPQSRLLIAEHTETPVEFRGRGVALALVQRMVEDARRDGVRIRAQCSYVERERQRHPEWADVFDVSAGKNAAASR